MKNKKRMILPLFFACEIVLFSSHYFFGQQSITTLRAIQKESTILAAQMSALEEEVAQINAQIVAWNTDAFYKEKVAREELQMARAHEQIFYLL